jgi:hypothetical protein
MSLQSHNRRFRRLALERVEDRKLLAPVAFATGMENQLSAYKNDVAGGALPLYVQSQSLATNAAAGNAGLVLNKTAIPLTSFGSLGVNATNGTFSLNGGSPLLVIGSSDLPPVSQPILPITLPTPPQGPIDIGPIVGNPPGPISGPRNVPSPPAPPLVVGPVQPSNPGSPQQGGVPAPTPGNDPGVSITPAIALPKPAVEGNGGRSQVIDVAVSTGDGSGTASTIATYGVAGARANPETAASPSPIGVDAVMRSIARTDGAIASHASNQPTISQMSMAGRIAAGNVAAPAVTAGETQSQLQSVAMAEVASAPEPAIAIPAASFAGGDASRVKPGTAGIQPVVAGIYQRADVLAATALALAGHYAARRWRKTETDRPQPIFSWRKAAARS